MPRCDASQVAESKDAIACGLRGAGHHLSQRDRVRVTTRLVATANGKLIWQDAFEESVNDLGVLPTKIAAVRCKRSASRLQRKRRPSLHRPTSCICSVTMPSSRARRRQSARRATIFSVPSTSTGATRARYAGLAKTWLAEADFGYGLSSREAAARAQPLLDKAFTLEPDLLEALIVQGVLYTNFLQIERCASLSRARGQVISGKRPRAFHPRPELRTTTPWRTRRSSSMRWHWSSIP